MLVPEFLKFIAGIAGTIVLALVILILINYFRMPRSKRKLQIHIICVGISYLMITWGTIRSVFHESYKTVDIWHFLVVGGWLIGIISLVVMFKYIVKRREQEKISDFINQKNKVK